MSEGVSLRARYVDQRLLDGRLPDWSRLARARFVDAELRRTRCVEAQLLVLAGRGADALLRGKRYRQLGHPDAASFIGERLGQSVGAAYAMRDLATRLSDRPVVREAFLSGSLCKSKVRALLRVPSADHDEGWVAFALKFGVRDVERAVKATHPPVASDEVSAPERDRVSWRAAPWERAAWQQGLEMMRVVAGGDFAPWKLVELLCADAGAAGSFPVVEIPVRQVREAPYGRVLDRERLEEYARAWSRHLVPPVVVVADPGEASDPWEILERTLAVMRRLTSLSYERAMLLSLLESRVLLGLVGSKSVAEHAGKHLGMSPREVREALDLLRATCVSPRLVRAWHAGMPMSVVALLAEVTTPFTAQAWIDFAQRASRKRLVLEARWHLAALPAMGRERYLALTGGLPDPSVAPSERMLQWQAFFEVEGVGSGLRDDPDDADPLKLELAAQLDESRTTLTLEGPEDVVAIFRATVENECGGDAFAEGVTRLFTRFARENATHHDDPAVKRWLREHRVFERDGWQCCSPFCGARCDLHGHHVKWRSRGGSDHPSNIAAHCWRCHQLIHDGFIEVSGEAPGALTYRVGRLPDGTWRETWVNGILVHAPVGVGA